MSFLFHHGDTPLMGLVFGKISQNADCKVPSMLIDFQDSMSLFTIFNATSQISSEVFVRMNIIYFQSLDQYQHSKP